MSTIRENYLQVLEEVGQAADQAGRKREDVGLVAVSKFHSASAIQELYRAGHLDFGENYAQEATKKQKSLQEAPIRWHFLGGMQTNKAKYLAGSFHLIHSLDSVKLAGELERRAQRKQAKQAVLLQINLGEEAQKSGADPKEAKQLCEYVLSCSHLQLKGLMTMPPLSWDAEANRRIFSRLRRLKQDLEEDFSLDLPHLSMGMSHDFREAVLEGATLIRIGTRIFGQRPGN